MTRNIRISWAWGIGVVLVMFSSCDGPTSLPPIGSISGEVTTEGRGLDGVTVSLSDGTVTTTAEGSFRFDRVTAGTYQVSISGYPEEAEFRSTSMSVTVGTEGGMATIAFGGSMSNSDRDALVALYNATDGPNWTNNTNWLTDAPLGEWYGVSTNSAGRVVELDLSGYWDSDEGKAVLHGLKGPIPGQLGNLAEVTRLVFTWNELTSIPPELGRLANLAVLDLNRNDLSGPIPPELGNLANLTTLALYDSDLTSIPPELGDLGKLQELWLGGNNVGTIPPELGNLGSLRVLDLRFAGVTGTIPPELGNLTNLTDLWIDQNNLSGPIPSELGNLANLQVLQLFFNNLSGPIPPELGNLSRLQPTEPRQQQLVWSDPTGTRQALRSAVSTDPLQQCVRWRSFGAGQSNQTAIPDDKRQRSTLGSVAPEPGRAPAEDSLLS